jgi:hypothetical protein
MPPVLSVANALASQPTRTQTQVRPFVPHQGKVVFSNGNPAKGINSRSRAKLLKVINETRTGAKLFTIDVAYECVTESPRRHIPADYQAPPTVSKKLHSGVVVNARETQAGNWILVLKDTMRSDRGEAGYTSLRLDGLRSFKVQIEDDGPLAPRPVSDLLDGDTGVIDIV